MTSIRTLAGPADAEAVTALMAQVWQVPLVESPVDPATLIALAHAGSYVALAEDDGELVGASAGFLSSREFNGVRVWGLHSHITGVRRSATGLGLGRALKRHQRDWCLRQGLSEISWTFDPLVARNAHFNLNTLGARPVEYLVDFYGTMPDGLNLDHPTDRLLVRWDLRLAAAAPPTRETPSWVGIPGDIEEVRTADPAAALAWRLRLRAELTTLLAAGRQITGYDRVAGYRLDRVDQRGH